MLTSYQKILLHVNITYSKNIAAIVSRTHLTNHHALSAYVTVLDPLIDRTKYHLLYITRHPLGIIKFMEQSEIMADVQTTVRAAAKLNKNNKSWNG
jgi:hypothetical protein